MRLGRPLSMVRAKEFERQRGRKFVDGMQAATKRQPGFYETTSYFRVAHPSKRVQESQEDCTVINTLDVVVPGIWSTKIEPNLRKEGKGTRRLTEVRACPRGFF